MSIVALWATCCVISEKKRGVRLYQTFFILSHLESWQSVTSSNKQNVNGQCFYGMFNIVGKSVIFLDDGTFTWTSSAQEV